MGHRCAAKRYADVLSPQVSRQLDHVGWSPLERALPTALWGTSLQAAPSGSKDNDLPPSREGGLQHLDNVPQPITDKESVCLMCPRSAEQRPGRSGWGRGKESRREVLVATASDGSPKSLSSHICTETILFIVQTGILFSFEINFNEV